MRHIFAAEEGLEAKGVDHAIAEQPVSVALLGVTGKPTTLYLSQSAGGPADMGDILRQVLARFGGKGGGTRDFAQGGEWKRTGSRKFSRSRKARFIELCKIE